MLGDVRADVLLVTTTKVETHAVLEAFGVRGQQTKPQSINGRVYFDLGTVNRARLRLTRCEMGPGGLGGAQQAVDKGIATLSPAAVVMVGIAFGVNEEKQSIGDILVTEQLRPYDLQRIGTSEDGKATILLRDDKPHASPWLLNLFKSSEIAWEGAPLRFGTVLTGAKLIDNIDFREQLRTLEPEAIGGEMEGGGLYVACQERKVDWILVKAICDFADGHKAKEKSERQALAAKNAASLVHHVLHFVEIDWGTHHNHVTRPDTIRENHEHKQPSKSTGPEGAEEVRDQYSAVRHLLTKKHIDAMERLWGAALALRNAIPAALYQFDYVTEEEYPTFIASARGKDILRGLTENEIAQGILQAKSTNIEDIRPFIGEALWRSFDSYRSFLARASLVTIGKVGKGGPWYKDDATLSLLARAITPQDFSSLGNLRIGKFDYARRRFEEGILAHVSPVLSGSVSARREDAGATATFSLVCGDTHSLHRQHQVANQIADFDLLVGMLSASPSQARQCDVSFDAGMTWNTLVLRTASASQISWKGLNARASATFKIQIFVRV